MIKCPRCNIKQALSAHCELRRHDFIAPEASARPARALAVKWAALLALIFFLSGAAMAAYGFSSFGTAPDPKLATGKSFGNAIPDSSSDKDLHTVVRELSGDVGIVSEFTGGSTKGSVIAMVVFSIVGLGYLTYGKKSQQLLMIVCGIGLMGYSYFIDGTIYIILIGLALSALPFVLARK
jgi:hypothetical protein